MGAAHTYDNPAYVRAIEAACAVGCSLANDDEVVISCLEYQALVWLLCPELLRYRLQHEKVGLQVAPAILAQTVLSDWCKKGREIAARVIQLHEESPKGEAQVMLNFHRPALELMAGVAFHQWALEGRPLPLAEPKAAKKKKGAR